MTIKSSYELNTARLTDQPNHQLSNKQTNQSTNQQKNQPIIKPRKIDRVLYTKNSKTIERKWLLDLNLQLMNNYS